MIGGDNLLLAYAITEVVACVMPGPAVLSVASIGLTGSLRGLAGAIAGINASNILWYAMVGAGLVALVHGFPELFLILRWAGIAYLLWLGVQTWRHPAHLAIASGLRKHIGFRRGFIGAVAVQLSNPKALVFFTVFLPPFIDVRHPVTPQLVRLALIGISLEILALTTYGLLAWRLGKLAMSPQAERWIARGSGAILIAIAVAMALSGTT